MEMIKNEVTCLILLRFLEEENDSERGSQSFAKPKHSTNQVRYLSDFKILNKNLKCKLHPMHRINKMLLNWEVFSTIHHLIQKWDIII